MGEGSRDEILKPKMLGLEVSAYRAGQSLEPQAQRVPIQGFFSLTFTRAIYDDDLVAESKTEEALDVDIPLGWCGSCCLKVAWNKSDKSKWKIRR